MCLLHGLVTLELGCAELEDVAQHRWKFKLARESDRTQTPRGWKRNRVFPLESQDSRKDSSPEIGSCRVVP